MVRVAERSNKLEVLRVNSSGFWLWHHSAMSNCNIQPNSVYRKRKYKIKLKLYMMRRISFPFLIFSVALAATQYQVETKKSLNEDLSVLDWQKKLKKYCSHSIKLAVSQVLALLKNNYVTFYTILQLSSSCLGWLGNLYACTRSIIQLFFLKKVTWLSTLHPCLPGNRYYLSLPKQQISWTLFYYQLTHTTLKNVELLKHSKISNVLITLRFLTLCASVGNKKVFNILMHGVTMKISWNLSQTTLTSLYPLPCSALNHNGLSSFSWVILGSI